jgi:hypothetical protein
MKPNFALVRTVRLRRPAAQLVRYVSMEASVPAKSISLFTRAITGQLPLWKAFWLVFIPAPLILYGIYFGVLWAWAILIPMTPLQNVLGPFSLFAFLLMTAVGVAVWRCSINSERRVWRYLARLSVVAYLVWYGLRVLPVWRMLVV